MKDFREFKRVLIGNKTRILYKMKGSNKLFIKHNKKMMGYTEYCKINSKKTKKMKGGELYNNEDLKKTVEIDGIKYIEDKDKKGTPLNDMIDNEPIPANKAYLCDEKVYNVDGLYNWIHAERSNQSVPHSRRPFTALEKQEIDNLYFTVNNIPRPATVSEEVANRFIEILNREYRFNHRHDDMGGYDMGENMGMAVRIMRELERDRTNMLITYPELNSRQVVENVLARQPRLLNEFRNWINRLPA